MERWRVVSLDERYRVSDLGRVKGVRQPLLSPTLIDSGYKVVSIGGKTVDVHTLVLEAFVGPCPEGLQGRHLNGKHGDNRLENLCWGTPKENSEDRVKHGTQIRGTGHHSAKLNDALVLQIRKEYAAGGLGR